MHREKSLCISLTKIPINIAQIHVFIFEQDICRYVDFYTSAQPPQITFIFMLPFWIIPTILSWRLDNKCGCSGGGCQMWRHMRLQLLGLFVWVNAGKRGVSEYWSTAHKGVGEEKHLSRPSGHRFLLSGIYTQSFTWSNP